LQWSPLRRTGIKPETGAIRSIRNADADEGRGNKPQRENIMENEKRYIMNFAVECKGSGLFGRTDKSGNVFGPTCEFPRQMMDFVSLASDSKKGICKELAACLVDGFEMMTISLASYISPYGSNVTEKSVRIIPCGYWDNKGYDFSVADKNRYDFSRDNDSALSKKDAMELVRECVSEYYGIMVQDGKNKLDLILSNVG